MNANINALNWFEIPAADINRAKRFYENIFAIEMPFDDMLGMDMVYFPLNSEKGIVSGAIVQSKDHRPSQDGVVIYLNANEVGIDNVLERVKQNNGKVVEPKSHIGEGMGYMAFFIDSEGNKIGLHADN